MLQGKMPGSAAARAVACAARALAVTPLLPLLLLLGSCDEAVPPPTSPPPDDFTARRAACGYHSGAMPAQSIEVPAAWPRPLPIDHVTVLVQENHSFDNYFGRL